MATVCNQEVTRPVAKIQGVVEIVSSLSLHTYTMIQNSASRKTHCSNLQGCWIKSFPKERLFYFAAHSHDSKKLFLFCLVFCSAWSGNKSETDLNHKRIIMKFIPQQATETNKPKFVQSDTLRNSIRIASSSS